MKQRPHPEGELSLELSTVPAGRREASYPSILGWRTEAARRAGTPNPGSSARCIYYYLYKVHALATWSLDMAAMGRGCWAGSAVFSYTPGSEGLPAGQEALLAMGQRIGRDSKGAGQDLEGPAGRRSILRSFTPALPSPWFRTIT